MSNCDVFTVLKAKRKGANDYVILCHLTENDVTPWATWHSNTIDGSGDRYCGHYFYDGEEDRAHADFDER